MTPSSPLRSTLPACRSTPSPLLAGIARPGRPARSTPRNEPRPPPSSALPDIHKSPRYSLCSAELPLHLHSVQRNPRNIPGSARCPVLSSRIQRGPRRTVGRSLAGSAGLGGAGGGTLSASFRLRVFPAKISEKPRQLAVSLPHRAAQPPADGASTVPCLPPTSVASTARITRRHRSS